jgi:hypothetical protein
MSITGVVARFVCNPKIQERLHLDQDQLYKIMLEFLNYQAHEELKEKMFAAGPRQIVEELYRDDEYE